MSDNKEYRGKIDRVRVAMQQDWEVDYFVKHYLESRKFDTSLTSRKALHNWLELYPKNGVVMRDELTAWLDAQPLRNK